ncbi:MAG: hypothetical protein ACRDH6_07455 [Actinomycetota bacterium]
MSVSPTSHPSGYHWTMPATGQREIIVINNTNMDWRSRIANRAALWSQAQDLNLTVTDGSQDPTLRQDCPFPAAYRQIRVCSYPYNAPWAGLARVKLESNSAVHIQSGWVKLDNEDLSFGAGLQRHVICQEVGHDLGLAHWRQPGNLSCMNDRPEGQDYEEPVQHDLNQIDNQTHYHGGFLGNMDFGDPLNGDAFICNSATCIDSAVTHRMLPNGQTIVTFKLRIAHGHRGYYR